MNNFGKQQIADDKKSIILILLIQKELISLKFIKYNYYPSYPMQTTNPDELLFQEETDTFSLTANLTDNKLTLTLKDFIEGIIYQKDYTKDHIGGQIHQKMDLFDIYTAFAQTKVQCDSQNVKEDQNQVTKIKSYVFGSIIEIQGVPCYKVERKGKVTVYQNVIDRKTKKQVAYQSKLELNKVRNLTQMEIFTKKSTVEKKNLFQVLTNKIQKQEKQKEELSSKIKILELENEKLRSETSEIKSQLNQLKTAVERLNLKNQQLAENLSPAKIQTLTIRQQSQAKLKQLNQELALLKQETIKLKSQNQQFQQQLQLSNDKINHLQIISNSLKTTQRYHILSQPYLNNFKIDGQKIQYISNDGQWTDFIINNPIYQKCSIKLKYKIIQTQYWYIMLGVVDYAKQKDQRCSRNSGHAMCYYGSNGQKYPSGSCQGDGFKQGDLVEVDIDRANSTIKYIVNGTLKATHTHEMLADGMRIFMPFVQMRSLNDVVELVVE